jgi:F-type H+-transporting ATPase subunit gamma
MANLKEIRVRLNSVKSTRQITSAMKMVSAAKLRRAQDSILQLRPFYTRLHEILQDVGADLDDSYENIYSKSSESGRILLVVITSNRGLCGAFNSNVVRRAILDMQGPYSEAYAAGKTDIIAVGKKGADILKAKGYKVMATYHQLFDKLTFDNTISLANQMMDDFVKGKYGLIKLIYNQFRNAAVQEVTDELLLPVLQSKETTSRFESHLDFIFEPSDSAIYDTMIPYALRVQFFRALLESSASEHGARMTAMHKATDNATDLIRELELTYNKARQASITKEILEIVGGAEALKG